VIGQALKSHYGDDEAEVLALIGGPGTGVSTVYDGETPTSTGDSPQSGRHDQSTDIKDLEAENDHLREELAERTGRIETLEQRLAALEAHIDFDSTGALADD
jgi:hypothetical protein